MIRILPKINLSQIQPRTKYVILFMLPKKASPACAAVLFCGVHRFYPTASVARQEPGADLHGRHRAPCFTDEQKQILCQQ